MNKNMLAHRLEIAFCGYSGVGKTTLVTKLISDLKEKYSVGYIKHDAHRFEMDREGKDTFLASKAGASFVFINDPLHFAVLGSGGVDPFLLPYQFLDCDFVFVEGYKSSKLTKILLLDSHNEYPSELKDDPCVLFTVGSKESPPESLSHLPYFQRDDISSIEKYILKHFSNIMESIPVRGLILTGGKSSRMGRDKSALVYGERSHLENVYDLLREKCHEVYISCRRDQMSLSHLEQYPQIHDVYLDKGPMGGILSAFDLYPESFWFVVACDLPFVDSEMIDKLYFQRDLFKLATCFKNPEKNWPAPLFTLYAPKSVLKFKQLWGLNIVCPRKVLFQSNIKCLTLRNNLRGLSNANTPKDYLQAQEIIKGLSL